MPDNPNSANALRARRDHHAASQAAAEAERARLLAAKAEAGARLPDDEMDDIEAEIARLATVVERAASRVEMIGPALAEAEAAEADIEERRNATTAAEQVRASAAAVGAVHGNEHGAVAGMQLRAAAIVPKPPASTIFDAPPPPKMTRNDEAFWEARRGRERAAAARRLAANA